MVAKKQGCRSIAPADKQINEEMIHPTSPMVSNWNNTFHDHNRTPAEVKRRCLAFR